MKGLFDCSRLEYRWLLLETPFSLGISVGSSRQHVSECPIWRELRGVGNCSSSCSCPSSIVHLTPPARPEAGGSTCLDLSTNPSAQSPSSSSYVTSRGGVRACSCGIR